ncbi:MAG: TIGR00159 family protein [Ruminococcaceae bacterium]|nr:TIGR00159 family protein [Oscillospiraceae bacterium]
MNTITDFFSTLGNYITTIGIADAFDILIVAFLIYQLIRLIRKKNSMRLARGIVFLLLILWISGILHLTMINYLLRRAVELGLIAILIIFQPELRRLLEKMGSSKFSGLFGGDLRSFHTEGAITQTVLACADMSRSRTGALIVFVRDNQLSEPISTGTLVDAEVTAELLKNIFFVKAPLHDGAVIIKDGRIAAAGCMLPMSSNMNLSRDLGMRHRAGIGMSERSDAVVVIVSEETGAISIAVDGMLKRHLSTETVETLLRKELMPEETDVKAKFNPLDLIRGKKNG